MAVAPSRSALAALLLLGLLLLEVAAQPAHYKCPRSSWARRSAAVQKACCSAAAMPAGSRRRTFGLKSASSPMAWSCSMPRACPSAACASEFVAFVDQCSVLVAAAKRDRSTAVAYNTLEASCRAKVASAKPKAWIRVNGEFLSADPGMPSKALSRGEGASAWGIWRKDPGPRGVMLSSVRSLEANGVAPAGWKFNRSQWMLEEHGLIMEIPPPLPQGRYKVQWLNYRAGYTPEVVLTISGDGWALDSGAKLYDVTHLPCRAAMYSPAAPGRKCLPDNAHQSDFPVTPGAMMPPVSGCAKLDYAVLFLSAYWG